MGRSLAAAGLATVAGGLTLAGQAAAAAPAAPPACVAFTTVTKNATPNVAIPDENPTGISSKITISGAPAVLTDADVTTFIKHSWSGDLNITLTSPQGTTVLLKGQTDLPLPDPVYSQGENDPGVVWDRNDVFNGTTWDDQASKEATETLYTNDQAEASLVPEGALGAFIGENPNGDWTLKVADIRSSEADLSDTGTLSTWSLNLRATASLPTATTTTFNDNANINIPDNNTTGISRTLAVAGAQAYLTDVNLTTFLPHADSSDLDVTLKSPKGTVVTITTDNGKDDANLFNGTVWEDGSKAAGVPPSPKRAVYVDGVAQPRLTAEGAFAAFIGENPNGNWTITVKDDAALGTGKLASWKLDIASTAGCGSGTGTPAPNPPPTPTTPVNPPVLPPITTVRLLPRSLKLSTTTVRDRTAPFTFGVSGTLSRPAGSTVCAGKVRVTVKAGTKLITSKAVRLKTKGVSCRFAAGFRFAKRPASLPSSGKLTLSAKFLGTTALLPKASATKTVRLG